MSEFTTTREHAEFRETRRALLNAPFVANGWTEALDLVARTTGSRGANLVCLGGGTPSLNLITGFAQDEIDRWFNDPVLWGPSNWRVGSTTRPFEIQHDIHYKAYREQVRTSDYCDVVHQIGMQHGCQTIFSNDSAGFIGLAIMRDHRDGAADTRCVDRFEIMSSLIARALKTEMALAGDGIRMALGQIDDTPEAVVLLNQHGWACGISRAAERLLADGVPLRLRGPRVSASDRFDDSRLQQLLHFLLNRDSPRGGAVSLPLRDHHGVRWTVHCTHLPPTLLALGFEPQVALRIERAQESPALATE